MRLENIRLTGEPADSGLGEVIAVPRALPLLIQRTRKWGPRNPFAPSPRVVVPHPVLLLLPGEEGAWHLRRIAERSPPSPSCPSPK